MSNLFIDNANRMYVIAVLTITALAGAYIAWGPTTGQRKSKRAQIPGLLNLGKSCFVNAVLQSIASSSSIIKWLGIIDVKRQEQKGIVKAGFNQSLLCALFKILKALNNQVSERDGEPVENVSAAETLQALRCRRWLISNDEQDAHEMFHVLTTTLEEELQELSTTPSLADIERISTNTETTITGYSKCCSSLPTLDWDCTRHSMPFRGLLANQLSCKTCLSKSTVRFDTFYSLSLPIPVSHWTPLTLKDCLRHFMMPEQVHDVECDKCTLKAKDGGGSKSKSTFIKRVTIGKLPNVLCIHIQRMAWLNNGIPIKRYDHVVFPEYLNVNEFLHFHRTGSCNGNIGEKALIRSLVGGSTIEPQWSCTESALEGAGAPLSSLRSRISFLELNERTQPVVSSSKDLFCLQAVIVHLGDVFSGHFVTYRRGEVGSASRQRWHLCSDASVREVSLKEVLKSQAYMLLYERRPVLSEIADNVASMDCC